MTDALFHVLEDAFVVLVTPNGVYRQAKLYRRGIRVFAGLGTGYIALWHNHGTSHPKVRWDAIVANFTLHYDRLGRMLTQHE